MGPKVVPSNRSHRDSYPSFYKGNHWDYHLSLLPLLMPLPFLTIFNRDSGWDPIPSFEAL